MLYAACKAKVFQKEKNCQKEMRIFLQDVFKKYSNKSHNKWMNFICGNHIARDIMTIFNEADVKKIDDIPSLEIVPLEKLFFSLHLFYQENGSRFHDSLTKNHLKKIVSEYIEIDAYHSPQL